MRRALAAAALLAWGAIQASGQEAVPLAEEAAQGTPSSQAGPAPAGSRKPDAPKAPDMSKPPSVGIIEAYHIPPRIQWKLANGMEVVLIEDKRVPLVTAHLAIRSGSAAVPSEFAGLADATAELLTEGTSSRSSKQISDAVEEYGGTLAAQAGADSIVIESSCLSERAGDMLALLAEAARFPSFPKNEVRLRKKNMKQELDAKRADDDFLASVAFFKRLYRSHPYAVTAPTDRSIAAIERKHIVEFHRKLFTPRNATLVLVGDIGYESAMRPLQARFGSWKGAAEPVEAPAVVGGHDKRRVYLVDRPGSIQSTVFMGNLAVRQDHPQHFNLLLANQVLGGTFSSRLMQDIREDKGFTYSVWSKLEHRLTSSIIRVRTPVRTEVTVPALEAVFEHLENIRDKGVSEEELRKAKSFLIGSFAMEMETQEGLARALVQQKILRLPEDYYDSYVENVEAVTADGALKAARTFIRPEEMTVVVVGEAAKIRERLARFSEFPVVPVDLDGN
ncbi:MAG: insulinase family protein [Elusimicrobia bacterium]|nr:insulinase family protein [Elusimicrobiota bacterium]